MNYVDKNAITADGGVVYGDIKLSVGSGLIRSLGCNDPTACKKFTLLLGTDTYTLTLYANVYPIQDYQCLSR